VSRINASSTDDRRSVFKIVAYLEIALARARADFSEASREHVGLFQLGRRWRVDDTRDETPVLPSTLIEARSS
jgi:hypothetical protein